MQALRFWTLIREEWFLAVGGVTSLLFLFFGPALSPFLANPVWLAVDFVWIFVTILGCGLSVVRHADFLAAGLGEPYGTLILTLSVTTLEVISISAVMLHGANNPTLVRDTLFAIIMIVLNGMVGLSLLAGGLRYREQLYNLQGANAYLGVIIPLSVLGLVLPDFTESTPGPTFSSAQELFLALMSVGLYGAFLALQSGRHREFFTLEKTTRRHTLRRSTRRPMAIHALLLAAYMTPVAYLADHLGPPIDYVIETLRMPTALGGIAIASLVATPEAISAVRAAAANHLQHAVNVFMGSVLSTIGLTIPAMLVVSNITGRKIALGVEHGNLVLLLLTLFVSVVTFASGRTNVLQGLVHVLLFLAYTLLIFQA